VYLSLQKAAIQSVALEEENNNQCTFNAFNGLKFAVTFFESVDGQWHLCKLNCFPQ